MISYQFLIDAQLRPDKTPDFAVYPFCLPAVRHLGRLEFDPAVTFIVGENGSGKSTLLEGLAVALGFNAEGGSKNFNFGTRDSHSCLHEYLRVARGVRKPRDGYFLRGQLLALKRIHQLVQEGTQFVIATHSSILMAYPEASIFVCTPDGIRQRAYEDTEHYEVMHDFMANPRRMLKELLAS